MISLSNSYNEKDILDQDSKKNFNRIFKKLNKINIWK